MLKKFPLLLLLFILFISGFTILYFKNANNSIVYVDNYKLFEGFRMTKELKEAGEKELRFKKIQLDSLQFLLNKAADNTSRSAIMQQLINQKQAIEEFQSNYSQSNSEKIWERISNYTKDFAELKHYDLVIGSNGKEQLLYGKKDKDVTVLLLDYLNKRYEGFQ
ncbi:OmpH family outer membrane protein [Flavobacterium phycosphaerae]|uniref:OmpH family outer membrane protein n=1 Tax=Flavobacterium phycosphaerae TaxID=2697515 RepID=UPI00138A4373|nr:OmpH family outer membrane protein [Flavobacterium phycosphaerae]